MSSTVGEERLRELIGHSIASADFGAIEHLTDADLAALPTALAGQDDVISRFIVTASSTADPAAAAGYLARVSAFSNYPNLVKSAATLPADEALLPAALKVVDDEVTADQFNAADFSFPGMAFWGLAVLAARADVTVLDRLAARLSGGNSDTLLASLRRSAATRSRVTTTATADPPTAPQKVSEVKGWLAAHPDPDPTVLAPHARQKAAAKVAAIRTLGAIGGPAALEVLAEYAADSYSDAMLKEIHAAWKAFDRREFAAAMLLPSAGVLRLGETGSVEGIDAVSGLTSLELMVAPTVDLAPLALCRSLTNLTVLVFDPGVDLAFVADLPALERLGLSGPLRDTDLAPLARTSVKRLALSLDGQAGDVLLEMTGLETLRLSGSKIDGEHTDPGLVDVVLALVRRGVTVAVYRHEKTWVPHLVDAATTEGLFTVEANGYVGLTRDASAADDLTRRLFSNLLP
ncbi:MAG: hypothetical protein QM597_08555 [Aeromicrobium sp.]|uniref:hypothetical protein n=1 Tax=Aeromicrobium sp. TaxID=1871063 RepID=UPI0039E46BC2